ncbi:histone methyltransferase set2, partial [Exophiala xenobiotica]
MFLQKGEYIDARKKGNLSRFFNHSCAPNCHIETWHVMGKLRVGIFAQRDIKAGEELVIDYKTDTRGAEPQKCACRAKNCKGHIGSKQPAKPRRIIRLRVGNKAVEDPPETSVMGDTIEVVHFSSAKSQVSTKRDEPQSPSSPVRDAETEIIAAPRSRQDCPDPGFSHSDTSILDDDLRLPLLPPLPPKFQPLTADWMQKHLAAIEQAEEQLIKQTNNLKARRVEEDIGRRQHNECEDREWDGVQQKRKERNEWIDTYRQNQNAAISELEIEMDFREN